MWVGSGTGVFVLVSLRHFGLSCLEYWDICAVFLVRPLYACLLMGGRHGLSCFLGGQAELEGVRSGEGTGDKE